MRLIIAFLALALIGCNQKEGTHDYIIRTGKIMRICHDGAVIIKTEDGRLWGYKVLVVALSTQPTYGQIDPSVSVDQVCVARGNPT